MEIAIYQQTLIFLRSFVLGALLFAVFMIMEIVNIAAPPGKIRLFVSDMIFMLFAAVMNFLFALSQTKGNIRGYSVFAQVLIFCLLYFTLGRLIKRFAVLALGSITRCVNKVYFPAASFFSSCIEFFGRNVRKILKKIKKC